MTWAYYNEFDPYAADWLRNLMAAGHIPSGEVDERSIVDVRPDDLAGFDQCHFFAGIAGWPLALRAAGWPVGEPVWTGSCPCQPFSAAGKRKGTADERHLWPEFRRLIAERRPPAVLGEQVASAIGHGWLDGVSADLEGEGYACGAAVLGAHSVGAPHIRQRLFWVADAGGSGLRWGDEHRGDAGAPEEVSGEVRQQRLRADAGADGLDGRLADAARGDGASPRQPEAPGRTPGEREPRGCGDAGGLEHTPGDGWIERRAEPGGWGSIGGCGSGGVGDADEQGPQGRSSRGDGSGERASRAAGMGPWSDFELIPCRDGKARRTQPGLFPLAHGVPARVGRLRAYGNAIVPQVAAEFIRAYREARG